ncbi:DUF7601 domain-containing protein [Breznakia pachnodae]|uniref:DUF7601 domain-containing protein n=1 Tax=Breznakia pachnodae TaxID=265178 RepID=A0ABU0E1F1_9FIRM|nr:DUF5979 domain-containing protein [Breznakia pachnodae]MDQ0360712.1 hypothetical protein [Breznakia pachnodae]
MRKIKKIVSIFMIAAVAFTVAVTNTSINADDSAKGAYSSAPGTDAVVKITKEIVAGEGVSLDTAERFTFTAALKEVSTGTYTDATYNSVKSLSTYVDFAINTNGDNLIAETNNIFTGTTYPHAGIYVYTVTESTTNANGHLIAGETYTMYVYVYNKPDTNQLEEGYDGTYIHAVTVAVGDLSAGDLTTDPDIEDKKVDLTYDSSGDVTGTGFRFKGYYNEATGLDIQKKVEGDLVNLNDEYDFTVVFTFPSSVEDVPSSVGGPAATQFTFAGITYTIKKDATTISSGNATSNTVTFKLKADEIITFDNLPAGTTYTVTEAVPNGFTASASVTEKGATYNENSVQVSSGQVQADRGNGMTPNLLAAEKKDGSAQNKVVYKNTETDVSITGLIIDNLPFIALMGVGIVGLVYIALNKKRKSI